MVATVFRTVVSVFCCWLCLSTIVVNAVEQRRYYEFTGEMDLGSMSTTVSDSALEAWQTLTGRFFASLSVVFAVLFFDPHLGFQNGAAKLETSSDHGKEPSIQAAT